MKTLKNFKKSNIPARRVSTLQKYKSEIFELYIDGYTVQQIIEFLKINGVIVKERNIYKFLENNNNQNTKNKKENINVTVPNKPASKIEPKSEIEEPVVVENSKVLEHFMNVIDDIADD